MYILHKMLFVKQKRRVLEPNLGLVQLCGLRVNPFLIACSAVDGNCRVAFLAVVRLTFLSKRHEKAAYLVTT